MRLLQKLILRKTVSPETVFPSRMFVHVHRDQKVSCTVSTELGRASCNMCFPLISPDRLGNHITGDRVARVDLCSGLKTGLRRLHHLPLTQRAPPLPQRVKSSRCLAAGQFGELPLDSQIINTTAHHVRRKKPPRTQEYFD